MVKNIIVITGATASGKTTTSIKLAKALNSEIICADSRIVYKNFDIVSAKPNLAVQNGIKHHLIDILEADRDFSAGDFVKLAKEKIEKINSKYIIIQGGTWFYIKSLLDKKELINCPSNKKLREELKNYTNIELWQKLNVLDVKRAQLIHPNNRDKIIRSIEMCVFLNSPVSEFKRKDNLNYSAKWYMMNYEREELYERINKRVDIMLDEGLADEWEKNRKIYPCGKSSVMYNTIGYREFFDLENGIYKNYDEAKEKIKQHTRNFAKRQITYFKSNNEIKTISNSEDILKDLEND